MKRNALAQTTATSTPASDIFAVNGTTGNDGGMQRLVDLMAAHGLPFYKSAHAAKNAGPRGIVAKDDVIIVKVNSQWDERGGTNTDLVRSLITAIVEHPDDFSGEVVIADNGQGQYGGTGHGGGFEYLNNNAADRSHSLQKVVSSFTGHRVSTYLWDDITTTRVREYSDGDAADGYVILEPADPQTKAMVSYPKFTTKSGTQISLKHGVWDRAKRTYDSSRLKLINVPVLKSHHIYGVTACVKHYMGVGSDKLTAGLGARMHVSVATGGMGTMMAGTRFPALNILDATWVNATPGSGPGTKYDAATQAGVIAAGTDPVALDCWAARNILMRLARDAGHADLSPIDPDNTSAGSFGHWLRLAMAALQNSGYPVTSEASRMNIYVAEM